MTLAVQIFLPLRHYNGELWAVLRDGMQLLTHRSCTIKSKERKLDRSIIHVHEYSVNQQYDICVLFVQPQDSMKERMLRNTQTERKTWKSDWVACKVKDGATLEFDWNKPCRMSHVCVACWMQPRVQTQKSIIS